MFLEIEADIGPAYVSKDHQRKMVDPMLMTIQEYKVVSNCCPVAHFHSKFVKCSVTDLKATNGYDSE